MVNVNAGARTFAPSTNMRQSIQTRRRIWNGYALIGLIAPHGVVPNYLLVTVLGTLVVYDLLLALDEAPTVRELAAFIATLQYIVGPFFLYTFFNTDQRYRMYVPPGEYFSYAIPATCAFMCAMQFTLPVGSSRLRIPKSNPDAFGFGMILIAGGLVASVISRVAPGSLAFLFYLFANFRYVGALYVYMSGHSFRWPIVAGVVTGIYLTSTQQGMFHELLLWASLGGSYWFIGKSRAMSVKLGCIAVAICAIAVIQVVKPTYRKRLARNSETSFLATTQEIASDDGFLDRSNLERVTIRVSQGWIVSATMYAVPRRIPYANGKTIKDALIAATVPRVLNPNKKIANARANVNQYTFLRVRKTAQMGLGPLGEGWANFGYYGGIAVMFCFGLLLNSTYRILVKLSWKNEFFFFAIPLAFLQVVKAETEFLSIFNHITKSFFIILVIYYVASSLNLLPTNNK